LPHPATGINTDAIDAAANANRAAVLKVCRGVRGVVGRGAAIIAKCKTAPALLLVVIMLKVDCKSVSGRVGDGWRNGWWGGGSGLAEGDS
jgi:hypothetical protein